MSKAAKHSTLLKSILLLVFFYTGVTFTYFGATKFESLRDYYARIPAFLDPHAEDLPEKINVFTQWPALLTLLEGWSIPIIKFWGIAILAGVFVSLVAAWLIQDRRTQRRAPSGEFRGVTITIGELATPDLRALNRKKGAGISYQDSPITFNPLEQALYDAVGETLAAYPNAYAGIGHGEKHPLFKHTMNVVLQALRHPEVDTTLVLIAISHDIGKLVSYKPIRRPGHFKKEWMRIKDHAQESAKILTVMPEYLALQEKHEEQAEIIRLAIKYDHCPDEMPIVPLRGKAQEYIARMKVADGAATAEEKAMTIAAHEAEQKKPLHTILAEEFLNQIKNLPFHIAKTKGTNNVGQKKKGRLYFMENELRKHCAAFKIINPELAAAASVSYRKAGAMSPFTIELLKGLHEMGLLSSEEYCSACDDELVTVPPECALWQVQSGKRTLNAVFIVTPPPHILALLPPEDSIFEPFYVIAPQIERLATRTGKKKPNAKSKASPPIQAANDTPQAPEQTSTPTALAADAREGVVLTEPAHGNVTSIEDARRERTENQLAMPGLDIETTTPQSAPATTDSEKPQFLAKPDTNPKGTKKDYRSVPDDRALRGRAVHRESVEQFGFKPPKQKAAPPPPADAPAAPAAPPSASAEADDSFAPFDTPAPPPSPAQKAQQAPAPARSEEEAIEEIEHTDD